MNGDITVTQEQIVDALVKVGIKSGDCIIVHSSLSSFGYVINGADAVIDAVIAAAGREGTVVMPALCQRNNEHRFETWDIKNSPSDAGRITEVFRTRPQSIRSDHPTHSVAASGRLANYIADKHRSSIQRPGPWGGYAFGHGSPWQKLYELDAGIVLVGVDFKANTMVHFIEHLIVEKALVQSSGDMQKIMMEQLYDWNRPGVWSGFDRLKLQYELDRFGLINRCKCGDSLIMKIDAKDMVDNALMIMGENPCDWFNKDFCKWLDKRQGFQGN